MLDQQLLELVVVDRSILVELMSIQSLALALYFASRGIGFVRDSQEGEKIPYTSTARVLVSDLG